MQNELFGTTRGPNTSNVQLLQPVVNLIGCDPLTASVLSHIQANVKKDDFDLSVTLTHLKSPLFRLYHQDLSGTSWCFVKNVGILFHVFHFSLSLSLLALRGSHY